MDLFCKNLVGTRETKRGTIFGREYGKVGVGCVNFSIFGKYDFGGICVRLVGNLYGLSFFLGTRTMTALLTFFSWHGV